MKIVQLNSVCGGGSTGGITVQISDVLTANNIKNYILYTCGLYNYSSGVKYSTWLQTKFNALLAKIFGNYGFNSYTSTFKLIRLINKIRPDIVHLHNIHSHDLNLSIFFKYLKKTGVRVIWTFHDCWAFTGYCMHFDMLECTKWQSLCKDCPQAKKYSFFTDKSQKLFTKKKELFTSISDMTIVTPSKWLAELTKHSFLNKYPIETIYNGIDLDVFIPRESNFREKHNLENKKIVLGIPKGKFEYFLELNELLSDEYKLVLVGLKESDIEKMPSDILALPYTKNRIELAEIFTASDVYINTTLEDTFPTVNLESLACGTPVITFNTGGSPEAIDDNTGMVVSKRNINAMYEAVKKICNGPDLSKNCIERANRLYNKNDRFNEYLDLYLKRGRFE
jgi:glycosyltransferase involved in cell wall biosynthesis